MKAGNARLNLVETQRRHVVLRSELALYVGDGFLDFLQGDRLGDHEVHSAVEGLLSVGFLCVASYCEDEGLRHLISLTELTNPLRGLVAIHLRHVTVHEDYVIVVGLRLALDLADRLHAVERRVNVRFDVDSAEL